MDGYKEKANNMGNLGIDNIDYSVNNLNPQADEHSDSNNSKKNDNKNINDPNSFLNDKIMENLHHLYLHLVH